MIVVCVRSMWVPLEDALTWIVFAGVSVIVLTVLLVLWVRWLRRSNKRATVKEEEAQKPISGLDFTLFIDNVERAREEMGALELERRALRQALTLLNEAEAKGEINNSAERRLLEKYKNGLQDLEEKIARNQALITLYEQMGSSIMQKPSVEKSSKEEEEKATPEPAKTGKVKTGKKETDEKIKAVEKEVLETLKMLEKLEAES